MGQLTQDLRYAGRTFRKAPVFVAVAVFSLAFGIGANTAIFTLVDQLLLRLLPVKDPQQLVMFWGRGPHYGSNNGRYRLSYPMYEDFRDHTNVFSGVVCRYPTAFNVSAGGKTERVDGEMVSGTYFPVLGVGAALGRVFTPEDDRAPSAAPYAVLSYRYWLSRYAANPDVIGQKILVNGYPLTIVGVSQAGFDGTDPGTSPALRVPIMMNGEMNPVGASFSYNFKSRRGRWVNVIGRLKAGVTLEQAKTALQPYFHQMLEMEVQEKDFANAAQEVRQSFLTMWIDLLPAAKGDSGLRRQFSDALLVLTAVVAFVLLIACANVANLLIARATARQKEIAVRLALGAGRRRIVTQLLIESLALAFAGGIGGLGLAVWMDRSLMSFLPTRSSPIPISTTPDWRILTFNIAVSLLTGIIFGLVPALQATRPHLAGTLKDQVGSIAGGTSVRLRKTLVAAQVALSLLLLIGAGLFIRTLRNLKALDPGFQTSNLIEFSVNPTMNGYKPDRSLEFYRQLREKIMGLPGIDSATLAVMPVLGGGEWDNSVSVEGFLHKPTEAPDPHMQFVSPDYFKTLNIPILQGRDFRTTDVKDAPKVCIVNERFAKKYFKEGAALGRHIGMGGNPGTKLDIEIVGIARDTKYESMREEVPFEVYQPYTQTDFVIGMTAYVRTARQPEQAFPTVRQVVNSLDSNLPVSDMKTLEKQQEESLITERLVATLSAAFGILATLLAAIGLYGVMAYIVAQRTREIGVRIALGAETSDVLWMIMKEVALLAAIGIVIGLSASYGVTRFAQSQLYGIQANDTFSIAMAILGIVLVAFTSGFIPARRAANVDPIRALRWE
jgi:predicted permease